ncbi:MAG: GTPase ObgE [Candidatus Colwellbacteria bacterium]|nr:GTPase ObgE [Candidatus Colwellbacteria bacterium]
MLIDEAKIEVSAGNGGNGAIAFNKNMMSLGPAGGSGGRGGAVYFEGIPDIAALNQFRFKKTIEAENGADGRGQFRDGHDGRDIVVKVPVGTVIKKTPSGETLEITKIGERLLIARGGHGGKGNFLFRSPTRTSPKIALPGVEGEKFSLDLELKMIADVGFVGLPNAGKSSLLNELTRASVKVGNYAFTTLEPNLGTYYDLILSDIPGLIEGASSGKGLGAKFLRHIERTRTLFHLISAESKDPVSDYKIIRKELIAHSGGLAEKKERVFISKKDMSTKEQVDKIISDLKAAGIEALPISIHDIDSIEMIRKILNGIIEDKTVQ